MTDAAQQSQYPATLQEWEYLLTRALLRADLTVSDPIRSFEITPETLAQYCGLGPEHARDAETAFRLALKADPYLYWSLQNGAARAPSTQVPNCMAMLAMSLLVDSLLDSNFSGSNQYREKLAQWLGIGRSFMNLSGIATMWVELAGWLDERIAAGEPFRALILPDAPRSWTHIGYTRYLSFPTKRDVVLLRTIIEKHPKAAEDPSTLVVILDRRMPSSSVSYGMQAAFPLLSGIHRARHICGFGGNLVGWVGGGFARPERSTLLNRATLMRKRCSQTTAVHGMSSPTLFAG